MGKPTLLCDQDGVIAGFDAYFFERCARAGFTLDCTVDTQTARFATDHIPDRAQRKAARYMVNNDPDWFYDLPVVPGAIEGLAALTEVFDVWICTKPLEANLECRSTKAAWVRKHLGADWERRLILTPDKSMIRGDILLDDAPKHEWFDRATWAPVIFDRPFNRAGSVWADLPRWSWGEPVEKLLAVANHGGSLLCDIAFCGMYRMFGTNVCADHEKELRAEHA